MNNQTAMWLEYKELHVYILYVNADVFTNNILYN